MAKYLVAGACGFIGSNFVHHILAQRDDATVVAVDNMSFASNPDNLGPEQERVVLQVADICDYEAMTSIFKIYEPDYIVNFAAESHNDRAVLSPSGFARANALGAQTLLETSRRCGVTRHLHVSTIEVYGELGDGEELFHEGSALNAKTPYSCAKAAGDMFARAYMQTYPEMDVILTHCANNYGPYQYPEKLIPVVIINVLAGKKAPLYGDGLHKRDWLHVEDHCAAIVELLDMPRPEIPPEAATDPSKLPIFDVSVRNEMSNLDIVSRIIEAMGELPDEWIEHVADRPNHDRRYLIDPSKIERLTNWRPRIDFDTGLSDTVAWYLDNRDWWGKILERQGNLQIDWSETR